MRSATQLATGTETALPIRRDHRPVLPEESRGVVNVGRLDFDAASLSSALVRYLKMERVGYRLRVFGVARRSRRIWCPLRASNRDTLNLRSGFSCGELVPKLVRR
jgi:hypothetical protein